MIHFLHVCFFFYLSPSLFSSASHDFILFKKVGCCKKKERRTFCFLLPLSCSSRFLYSASFTPLPLSPRLLIVGFSNRSSLLCLSCMHTHTHTTSNTTCQGKQWSSQRHALTIQCNHFRQLKTSTIIVTTISSIIIQRNLKLYYESFYPTIYIEN